MKKRQVSGEEMRGQIIGHEVEKKCEDMGIYTWT